jgi:hypothetical protein
MKLQHLFIVFVCMSLVFSGCSQIMPSPTTTPQATSTPVETATPKPTFTQMPRPTFTATSSPTPNLKATEQYETMAGYVQDYFDEGYVSKTEGVYTHLKDYKGEWAKIDWAHWEYIQPFGQNSVNAALNHSVADVIVRSEIEWESASQSANTYSGCGFAFRINRDSEHYMAYVSVDGHVRSLMYRNGQWTDMGMERYGPTNTSKNGTAIMTVIMEGYTFKILIDDALVATFTGTQSGLGRGWLAYAILSGINTDFGTRCKFTNTDVWYLK